MSGVAAFLYVVAGIFLHAGASHLFLALRRRAIIHLLFGLLCLLALAHVLGAVWLYESVTTEEYIAAARRRLITGNLWNIAFVWFVALYSANRPTRFLVAHNAICLVVLLLNLSLPYTVLYSDVSGLDSRTLPWGESVQHVDAAANSLAFLEYLPVLLSLGFAYACCYMQIRRGLRSSALFLGLATSIQLVALPIAAMVDFAGLRFIYVGEFAFLSFIVLMAFRLVNEVERSDQALRESEQRFRQMAETIEEVFYLSEPSAGRILYVSPAYNGLIGQPDADKHATPLSWIEHIVPADRARVRASFVNLLSGAQFDEEYRIQRSDGSIRWLSDKASPIRDAMGNVYRHAGVARDITDRKEAEASLKQAETIQQLTLEQISDAVLITDDDGCFVFVCPNINAIFGYSEEEVQGMGEISKLLGDNIFDAEELERCGEVRNVERKVHDKSGCSHDVLINVRRVSINGGTRLFVCRDITERKQAEQALYKSEEELRAILNAAVDAIITIDQKGIMVGTNLAAEKIFGYRSDELMGQNVSMLMSSPYCDEHDGYIERYLQTGEARIIGIGREAIAKRKDGSTFPMDLAVSEVDHLGLFVGIIRDITDEKMAEEALRRAYEFSESIIEMAQHIVLVLDNDGRIVRFNPYLEELSGWRLEEVRGRSWFDTLLPERDRLGIRDIFDSSISGKRVHGNVNPILTKDGREREIEWYDAPLSDSDGQEIGLLCTGHDVTERRQLEREILDIADAEQRRIGQELHDGVSQELTGLTLLAGTLRDVLKEQSNSQTENAAFIAEGLNQALHQVRQLARGLIPVEIEAEGLRSALFELTARTNAVGAVRCSFVCTDSSDLPDDQTPTHLYRIAQEAISNALKHAQATCIRIMLQSASDRIVLSVSDDGKGIPATKKATDGMGLRIMGYRADLIGATLNVGPSEDGGTVVVCTVPKRG